MTTPNTGPRPVGPPPPPGKQAPPTARPTYAPPGPGPWSGHQEAGGYGTPPRVRVWSWSSSGAPGTRPFPWFAILLLVLGVGLLVEMLVPDLSFGSLIILAAGLACGAAWLIGHMQGATMPALVLTAWGLASVGTDLGILVGDGWTALFLGLAFLAGWALAGYQRVRRQWALVLGAIFAIIGLADVSDALSLSLDIAVVIPLAMIGIGVYLVLRDRLPGRD